MLWKIVESLFKAYRIILSPMIHAVAGPGAGCRFHPSCSQFAQEAFRRHGGLRGAWLSAKRLARCQPWGSAGHDPVPQER